jgi:parallel beta-helix repeat protein
MTLQLAPEAVLKATPVAAGNYGVVHVECARNVQISGGTIIGERDRHLGTTGEGGHGIRIWGSHDVLIDGVRIQDCWGDGIYVGATGWYGPGSQKLPSERVTVSKCVSRNNRRQGLSIVSCVGALIEDSEFSDTNGTAPESGIDLEPGANFPVTDITIRNCIAARNAGYGILVCGNTDISGIVTRVRIENNQCAGNGLAGSFVLRGASECHLTGNVFERNREHGVMFHGTNYNELLSNTLRDNSLGQPRRYPHVFLAAGSSHNTIAGNTFAGQRRLLPQPPLDIVVTPDCLDNVFQSAEAMRGRVGSAPLPHTSTRPFRTRVPASSK